jgi:hypothetical protein
MSKQLLTLFCRTSVSDSIGRSRNASGVRETPSKDSESASTTSPYLACGVWCRNNTGYAIGVGLFALWEML